MGKVPSPTRRYIKFYLQVAAAKGDRALGRGPAEGPSSTIHQVQVSPPFPPCDGKNHSKLCGKRQGRPGHKTSVGPIVPEEGNVQVPILSEKSSLES
jgi:hypothetical protein